MSTEKYQEIKEKYRVISRKLIDFLVVTYATPLVSLKRDYNSSLALEKRNFLNVDNLVEYNDALKNLEELFKSSVEEYELLDTTSMNMSDVSVEIASKIMPVMRKKYIEEFKKRYNLM